MGLPCLRAKSIAMKSLTSRPIFLLPLRYFATTPSQTRRSDSALKHLNDEENKAVGVTVWWDFENCHIPNGVSAHRVEGRITSALRSHGIKGPVTITAFGNVSVLSQATCGALCTTGITLRHVPNCGKNSTDRFILADLVYWVAKNPPPVHFFLITGDRDFASILHRLRMSNINILLASPSFGSTALYSAATIVWNWDALVRGDSLIGRHFNYPPDGWYGSWYAHYNASNDGSKMNSDFIHSQPMSEEIRKLSDDSCYPIPKVLVRKISQLLTSNPKGISISSISLELKKSQISVGKDYYGYKKLSSLVSSLPNVAIVRHSDIKDDYIAYHVYDKPKEFDDPISIPALNNTVDHDEPSNLVDQITGTRQVDMPDPNKENTYVVSMKDGVGVHEPLEEDDTSNQGYFQGIWRKWLRIIFWPTRKIIARSSPMDISGKNDNIEKMPLSTDRNSKESEKIQPEGEPDFHQVDSTSSNKVFSKKTENLHKIHCNDANHSISMENPHYLFSKKHFWDSLEAFLSTHEGLELVSKSISRNHLIQRLQGQGLLLLNSLTYSDISHLVDLLVSEKWVDECRHQTFPFKLKMPVGRSYAPSYDHGSEELGGIFSNRRSQSLSQVSHGFEDPVSQRDQRPPKNLVEFKAWYCKTFMGNVNITANDLNACFVEQFGNKIDVNSYGHSNIEDLFESCSTNCSNEEENRKRISQISEHKMLSDCQKLVEDCLRESPSGFFIGNLRPIFFKKYGYNLDYRRFGYVKLSDILKIFPGMRVKNDLVLPDLATIKSEVSETLNFGTETKRDANVSAHMEGDLWDVLGPLTETRMLENKRNKEESAVSETLGSGTGTKKDVNSSAHIEDDSWDELGSLTETWMPENKRKNEKQVELEETDFSDEEELRGSESHFSTKTGESKIQGSLTEIQMMENKRNNEEQVELENFDFSDEEEFRGSEAHRLTKTGESKIKGSLTDIQMLENKRKNEEKVELEKFDFSDEEQFRGSETHSLNKTDESKTQGCLTEIQILENKRNNKEQVGSEIHCSTKTGEGKIQRKSSLVEILESWNTKEDEKKMLQAGNELVDCSGNGYLPSVESRLSNTLKTRSKPKASRKDKFLSNLKPKAAMEDSFISYSNSSYETKLRDDVFHWLTKGNVSEQKEK